MINIRGRQFGWDGTRLIAIRFQVTSQNSKKDRHFFVISRALPSFLSLPLHVLPHSYPIFFFFFSLSFFTDSSNIQRRLSGHHWMTKFLGQTPEVPECCIIAICVFDVISFHKSTSAQENEGNTGLSSQVRVCFISILAWSSYQW